MRTANQEVAEHQGVHARPQKTVDGFFGAADDGLVVIERSIHHGGHAGQIAEFPNEPPIARIRLAIDGLQARRAVHVSGRGKRRRAFRDAPNRQTS